jgi:hypothetical protein
MSNQQFNNNNSINIDGFQVALSLDGSGALAKRTGPLQFAIPVGETEVYFWLLVKPLFQDAGVYIGVNGIMSEASWVADQGGVLRVDHQAGGDRGRFCVMRRQDHGDLVDEYAAAGVTGPLSRIDLEFRPLIRSQSLYRPTRMSLGDFGGGAAMRGMGMGDFGDAMRGASLGASKGAQFDEAIVATGGESDLLTRQVQREEDKTLPVIKFTLEIVATSPSSVRIPNPSGVSTPRRIFSW